MSKDLVQIQSFLVTLTKGGSWALLRKSAVEFTTLAQPFCVNHAVGGLPWHFHFMGEFSKPDRVKMMGIHWRINAIWWNIKINLQKLVDICGYELPTNLQNFTQKDLTEVKIFQKSFLGGYFFLNTLQIMCAKYHENQRETVAVVTWKSLTTHRQMTTKQADISHRYYKLRWLQAAAELITEDVLDTCNELESCG